MWFVDGFLHVVGDFQEKCLIFGNKREGWCEVTVVVVSMADNDNKGEIRERLIFGKWDEGNVRREKKRCGGRYTMGALVFVFF
jgi:hypothetical protein